MQAAAAARSSSHDSAFDTWKPAAHPSSITHPSIIQPYIHPGASHLVDLTGEVCAGGHVTESQRLVGWIVEETLVESRREEADGRTSVDQAERQQTAHIVVQVLTQGCARTRTQTVGGERILC